MKVSISAIHFSADQKLINFITERVDKLATFYDKIIASEATLKIEESEGKKDKLVEIKLSIPGKELFAKKNGKSFEEATDNASEALRRQLRKHKAKDTVVA